MRRHDLVAAGFLGVVLLAAQGQAAREQTRFSAEDAVMMKPVALPRDVLERLAEDGLVRRELENERLASDQLPAAWFSASAIRLGPRSDDLIVQAEGPLAGANVTTYWVFLTNPHGHRLALTAPALGLSVGDHRRNGYRDLVVSAATAADSSVSTLRFNGREYVLYRQKSTPIR